MIFNLQAIPQISDTFYLEQAKPAADRLTPQDFMSHVLTILVQNPHVNPTLGGVEVGKSFRLKVADPIEVLPEYRLVFELVQ